MKPAVSFGSSAGRLSKKPAIASFTDTLLRSTFPVFSTSIKNVISSPVKLKVSLSADISTDIDGSCIAYIV